MVKKAFGSQRCQCWLGGYTENVENCGEKNVLALLCVALINLSMN